ncbi:MAG: ABC transporter ATP-binding protein/permease [Lentisphaeria bacterium]|nr:ABC transporter ATP-binding protein/permease [Lentisphaeria bacterium]
MGSKYENEREFTAQSYMRLVRYCKPYWLRMTIGVICGFLVGGSLFMSIMVVPQLVGVVEPKGAATKVVFTETSQEILSKLEADPTMDQEAKLRAIENVLNPVDDDPQLTSILHKIKKYAEKYNLPVEVDGRVVKVEKPWKFQFSVVDSYGRITWQIFAIYVVGFVIAWTVKNTATYLNRYYTRWVGARVVADLRNEIFERLMNQSLRFYGKMDVGHLISRCTNDTSTMESSIANVIADLTRCPIEIFACVAAVVVSCRQYDDYGILVTVLACMPLIFIPIVILGRMIRKIYKKSLASIADVISRMHEVFTGIRLVKASNTEEMENNRFHQSNRKYFRQIVYALKLQLLMSPLMEIITVLVSLVFLLYAYSQNISITQIVALLTPALMAYQPVKDLSKVIPYIQRSMAAADRYFDLIDQHTELPEDPHAVDKKSFDTEIKFSQVTFAYDDHVILDNIDLSIPRGSMVAVVGETGSGKTTIANLIARFYDVDGGSVTIDGIDVRNISTTSLRKLIGVVTQEAILFNDTIANNIAYGCGVISREEIVEAAKKANAHNFIVDGRHAEGYDTEVGEKGFKLSGGEKQRVAIARAILKNPPILILDEATSALDTVTEALVQEALNNVMENRTVFAIAHRLSTIRNADKIIVLSNGKIAEAGTHDELMALKGMYYDLNMRQHCA